MATGTLIGAHGLQPVNTGNPYNLTITATQTIPRGYSIVVGFVMTLSGGAQQTPSISDPRGNVYTQEFQGDRATSRLRFYKAEVTTQLEIGDIITVVVPAGWGSGSRFCAEAAFFDKRLTRVAQASTQSAFVGTVVVTFTHTGASNVFIAMAGGGFDADDAAGAGDAQWSGHWDYSFGGTGVWIAYRNTPGANDSWNAPLQQVRDFYASGINYDESIATYGGSQVVAT